MRTRIRKGTTLIEILMAVVILGLVVGVMLESITFIQLRHDSQQERLLVLKGCQDKLDFVRQSATTSSLVSGSLPLPTTVAGVANQVTFTVSASLVAGTTNLYDVSCVATWNEVVTGNQSRVDLATRMIAPYD